MVVVLHCLIDGSDWCCLLLDWVTGVCIPLCFKASHAALPRALQLRPYQRRSLAHMLREEQAEGGSARHLWIKFNLPEQPGEPTAHGGSSAELQQPGPRDGPEDLAPHPAGTSSFLCPAACPAELHCYVSPVLRQMRLSTSKIEAEQWVGACGGAGWIALEVRGWRGIAVCGVRRMVTKGRPAVNPACTVSVCLTLHKPALPPAADGHGQDGVRYRRHPNEPAAAWLACQPRLELAARAGPLG